MNPFLPVLAYQKIGRAPKHSHLQKEWTSPRTLTKTLTWLAKHHFTCITPLDLQKPLPQNPVMLTFFGGYQSFFTEVFPLLQAHQMCATLFIAVETLGTYNSWQDPYQEPWQNILTPDQLREIYKSGRVQIGVLGLDGRNLLLDEPSQAQQTVREAIYRLKTLHKIEVCALGFWPGTSWNQSHAQHIAYGLDLPVITSQVGKNMPTETKFLRILRPGFLTRFLLQVKNKQVKHYFFSSRKQPKTPIN